MFKEADNQIEVGSWVLFDWAGYSFGLHPKVQSEYQLDPFSYAKVVAVSDSALEIITAAGQGAEITHSSVIRILPSPKAAIGEEVIVEKGSSAGKLAVIDSMFWHHKDEEYKYTLVVDGKKKYKRYVAEDLRLPG